MNRIPASYAQRRIALIEQLFPATASYHIAFALRLEGPIDTPALVEAFDVVQRRHETLRTCLESAEDPSTLLVHPSPLATLTLDDVTAARLDDRIRDETEKPFDLTNGPLLRALLYELGPEDHLLHIIVHHLVADLWSVGILVNDLFAEYSRAIGIQQDTSGAAVGEYSAYARQQTRHATTTRHATLHDYWSRTLRDAPSLLTLPSDRPRPPQPTFTGGQVRVGLPLDVRDAAIKVARDCGATEFMVLLSAWAVVLGRNAGTNDVVIATAVSDRGEAFEDVVGCFLNVLPLRMILDEGTSFTQLVQQARDTVIGAIDHRELPFDEIVAAHSPTRDLSYQPLAQTMFILQNAPLPLPQIDHLTITPVPVPRNHNQLDLDLELYPEQAGYNGAIEYSCDLFDRETIHALWAQFEVLLDAATHAPDTQIHDLPLTRCDSRTTARPTSDTDTPVMQRLIEAVRGNQHQTAVVASDGNLTYAELDHQVASLASTLRTRGVRAGDHVVISLPRRRTAIVAVLAAMSCGASQTFVEPETPAQRFALAAAGATLIITTSDRTIVPGQPPRLHLDTLSDQSEQAHLDDPPPDPCSAAYILYTSGTTGTPKGVVVEHRNLTHLANVLGQDLYEGPDAACRGRRWRVALSASFSFDTCWDEILSLVYGHELHLIDEETRRDPAKFAAYVHQQHIDMLDVTPTLCRHLLRAGLLAHETQPRFLMVGGEALDAPLWRRLAHEESVTSYNYYGPTETTVDALRSPVTGDHPTLGAALPGVTALILDQHLRPSPEGALGELWIGGLGVSRGYFNDPAQTADRFRPDPAGGGQRIYGTGDVVRRRRNGTIDYCGRNDNQVQVRGFRIELDAIDAALRAIPGVSDAVAALRTSAEGPTLVGWLVADDTHAPTTTSAFTHLRGILPNYQIPSKLVWVDDLPRSANGKIDRAVLPQLVDAAEPREAPINDLEALTAGVWAAVLEIEQVGRSDNFFELGGFSLAAASVAATLKEILGVATDVKDVFAFPTVAELAEHLRALGAANGTDVGSVATSALEVFALSDEEVARELAAEPTE